MSADTILDFLEPEDEPTVVLRYFYMDTEAQFAALELRNADIPCYISNSNAHTLLAVGQGWIGLHVRQGDLPAAIAALQAVDMWDKSDSLLPEEGAPTRPNPWRIFVWVLFFLALVIKYIYFPGRFF